MAKFPALPVFTDALLADTHHLTDEEFGRYIRLLILMWRSPDCKIPDDAQWICKRLRLDALAYAKHVHPILQEFCTLYAGTHGESGSKYWSQKRLLKEYQYVTEKTEKRRAAAKARWGKSQVPESKGKPPMQMHMQKPSNAGAPTPTPTHISLPNGKESCHPKDATYLALDGRFLKYDEVVDMLWKAYPRIGRRIRGKSKMSDQIIKILKERGNNAEDWKHIIGDLAKSIREYKRYCRETGELPADPWRWLRDKGHDETYEYERSGKRSNAYSNEGSGSVNQISDAGEKAKEILG